MNDLSFVRLGSAYTFVEDEYGDDESVVQPYPHRPGLALFSKAVCFFTFCLLFAGALVTSHDAGLAVPDWPTSYGYNMFSFPVSEWQGNIFYEHVHRLIASVIGAMTVILTTWIALVEERRWVRLLSYGALLLVVCQGILGGITVLYSLPDIISTLHGVLGQTFFVLTIIIAYSQSKEVKSMRWIRPIKHITHLFQWSLVVAILVYFQLIIGAWMRHSGAGLAVLDFPRMGGWLIPSWTAQFLTNVNEMRAALALPAVTWSQVYVHIAHRFSGVVVACAVLVLSYRLYRCAGAVTCLQRAAFMLSGFVIAQFALGVATVLTVREPVITSIHVWLGALLLGVAVLTVARLHRIRTMRKR